VGQESAEGNNKKAALHGLVGGLAYHSDPSRAAELALSLSAGPARDQAIGERRRPGATEICKRQSPGAAMPDGQAKQNALNSISWQWVQDDPKAAADYAQTLPPGAAQNNLLNSVANLWAQTDRNQLWSGHPIFRPVRDGTTRCSMC